MAPTGLRDSDNFQLIKQEWQNPTDIFSLLLIIGGDIIQKAIAQLAGGPLPVAPVAFSFGWVAYSVLAVMTVLGDGTLMPPPDTPCIVVNSTKGFKRQNNSWVLSRILRDWHEDGEDPKHALEVSICSAYPQDVGIPRADVVWFVGVATIICQCGIALIPVKIYGSWFILILTVIGTLLSLAQASLPQWKLEKWSCRINKSDKTIILTQGNGSRRVIVISSKKGVGLDLEDLASPRTEILASTLPWTIFFCVCWLALLLTATGAKQHTWYLIAISGLGSLHNVFAVGAKREPSAFGLHLKKEKFICPGGADNISNKVWDVIQATENYKPGARLGPSLSEIFFPGGLHPSETQWKNALVEKYLEDDPPPRLNYSSPQSAALPAQPPGPPLPPAHPPPPAPSSPLDLPPPPNHSPPPFLLPSSSLPSPPAQQTSGSPTRP